jgi:hypothetical protein
MEYFILKAYLLEFGAISVVPTYFVTRNLKTTAIVSASLIPGIYVGRMLGERTGDEKALFAGILGTQFLAAYYFGGKNLEMAMKILAAEGIAYYLLPIISRAIRGQTSEPVTGA